MDRTISFNPQKIAGTNGCYNRSIEILQLPQARPVEMIHMRMREQDEIGDRQLRQGNRRMNQPLHTQGEGSDPDPYTRAEHRIGENGEAIHAKQDGTVTNPGRVHTFLGPVTDTGNARRRLHGTLSILFHAPP
jgi:hypothetical protein